MTNDLSAEEVRALLAAASTAQRLAQTLYMG
jgi:hypothetical protein